MENQGFWNSAGGLGLMGVGGSIISGIGDYLGGGQQRQWNKEEMERKRQLYSLLMGQMNKPGVTSDQIDRLGPGITRSLIPGLNKAAETYSGRGNDMSGGDYAGEMLRLLAPQLQGKMASMKGDALFGNQQYKSNILNLMTRV